MSKKSQNTSNNSDLGILVPLALICVGISFYQTAVGYTLLAGEVVAWLFSAVISLLLFFLNFRFRKNLNTNQPVILILAVFALVATFSFAGNFNAFYSQFMRGELYDTELRDFRTKLTALHSRSLSTIESTSNADSVRIKTEQLKTTILAQIVNPGDPGWGPKTEKIAVELEKVLGTPLTRINGAPKDIATNVATQIESMLQLKMDGLTENPDKLQAEVQLLYDSVQPILNSALLPQNIESEGRKAIEETLLAYNSIGEKTQNTLGNAVFPFEPLSSQNLQVGKISHSFKSAFGENANSQSTLLALLASLGIDFLLPIVIFAVSRSSKNHVPEEKTRTNYTGKKGEAIWLD